MKLQRLLMPVCVFLASIPHGSQRVSASDSRRRLTLDPQPWFIELLKSAALGEETLAVYHEIYKTQLCLGILALTEGIVAEDVLSDFEFRQECKSYHPQTSATQKQNHLFENFVCA